MFSRATSLRDLCLNRARDIFPAVAVVTPHHYFRIVRPLTDEYLYCLETGEKSC